MNVMILTYKNEIGCYTKYILGSIFILSEVE